MATGHWVAEARWVLKEPFSAKGLLTLLTSNMILFCENNMIVISKMQWPTARVAPTIDAAEARPSGTDRSSETRNAKLN